MSYLYPSDVFLLVLTQRFGLKTISEWATAPVPSWYSES
jgi:hypothetical protein